MVKSAKSKYMHFTTVNVNVSAYSVKSPLSSADFTIYAPGIGTLSIQSHLLWGKFSICALC